MATTQSDKRTGGPGGIPWQDLVSNIINRHETNDKVLDDNGIAELKKFVSDENVSLRREAEARGDHSHKTANGYPALPEKEPERSWSLVDYIIRRHGTAEQKLLDPEIEELRVWFNHGGGAKNVGSE